MTKEQIEAIIKQILYNPQVSYPPISYTITDESGDEPYHSQYIDMGDFHSYLERLEKQLISRLTN